MNEASARTIRAILVDDEELARGILRELLQAHEDFEIIAECRNGFEAVKAVSDHDPDLLFLDIQMPKLDGFEVLELLDRKPIVVFVTAYDEYAIRAFEVHAADYLLKPFSSERFGDVLDHVRERFAARTPQPLQAVSREARSGPLQRILVRDGSEIEVLPIARLDYVEAQDDGVVLVSGEKRLRKQQPLGDLERMLDASRFIRIHRSYILNVDRLDRVELYAKDSRIAILKDGTRLPISRTGYGRLRALL